MLQSLIKVNRAGLLRLIKQDFSLYHIGFEISSWLGTRSTIVISKLALLIIRNLTTRLFRIAETRYGREKLMPAVTLLC